MSDKVKVTLSCNAKLIFHAKLRGLNLSKLLEEYIIYELGVRNE